MTKIFDKLKNLNSKEKIIISFITTLIVIIIVLSIVLNKKSSTQNSCQPINISNNNENIKKCSKHSECENNKCGMLNNNLTCCPKGFNNISNTIFYNGVEYCTGVVQNGEKCVDSRQCNLGLCLKEKKNDIGICVSGDSLFPKIECTNNKDCKSENNILNNNKLCNNGFCEDSYKKLGEECVDNNECKYNGLCKKNSISDEKGICSNPYKKIEEQCNINEECLSNWCQKGKCSIPNKKKNDNCDINEECESGICEKNKCKEETISLCTIS